MKLQDLLKRVIRVPLERFKIKLSLYLHQNWILQIYIDIVMEEVVPQIQSKWWKNLFLHKLVATQTIKIIESPTKYIFDDFESISYFKI